MHVLEILETCEMPLLNICLVSSVRVLLSWTVVQVDDGLTFLNLYEKIRAGVYPMLTVSTAIFIALPQ